MEEHEEDSFESKYEDIVELMDGKLKNYNDWVESRMAQIDEQFHNLLEKLNLLTSDKSNSKFSINTSRPQIGSGGGEEFKEVKVKIEYSPSLNNTKETKFKIEEKSELTNLNSKVKKTNEESMDTSSSDSDSAGDDEIAYKVRPEFKVPTEE